MKRARIRKSRIRRDGKGRRKGRRKGEREGKEEGKGREGKR